MGKDELELIDLGAATAETHGDPIDFEDEGVSKPNRREDG